MRRDTINAVRRYIYPDYIEITVYYGDWVPKTCYTSDSKGIPYAVDIACPFTTFRFDDKQVGDAFYKDLIEVD